MDLTDPEYLADVEGISLPMGDRVDLARLGLGIAYPEGWYAESAGPFTTIARDRSELTRWFAGDELEGPLIFFEVETFEFMHGMGLDEPQPTPDDLLEFSTRTFGWEEVRDHLFVNLFDGEGLQVRGQDPRGEFVGIQGVLPNKRAILVMIIAPTDEALRELLVTWRRMVGTIRDVVQEEAANSTKDLRVLWTQTPVG